MSKQRGLGRGLSALIPARETEEEDRPDAVLRLPVAAISPNPHQPRSDFAPDSLAELANSIQEHGLIQPVIVAQAADGRYTLIAGERRWRAAQLAGLDEIPAIVKDASSQAMLELALVENIQRADLNPLEEAMAYRQLIDEFGLTQDEVAKRVGKSRPAVGNTVRLLELPEAIKRAVVDGRISGGHARALLSLDTAEAQIALMKSILQHGWNVRYTEEVVRKMKEGGKPTARPQPQPQPEITALAARFEQSLGTRVNIQKGRKGGKIIIHFYSDEELQAIYEAIVNE